MNSTLKKPVSMSRRLTLALAFATTFIVVLVAGGFYWYTAAKLEKDFSGKVERTLSYLEGTLATVLWNVDYDTALRVAQTALQDGMVTGVVLRDEWGKEILSVHQRQAGAGVVQTRSIYYQDEWVGDLRLRFSRASLSDTLTNILLISLSVWLLAVFGIAVLTHLFIRKYFHGPLMSFIELAESYRQHPESPSLASTPFREFQPIEKVVKKLANDVFLRLRELEDHRRHLETEVAERTHDLKIARDEAEKARTKAEGANQAKSIFLANMSHELRTPLNAILGFSEILGHDHDATPNQQVRLDIINRSGEHLLGMINDVLDLSKIEAGRVDLEPQAFDLVSMLEDIGRVFEARAEDAGLQCILELEPAMVRFVKADDGKLRQILINLLGNAVKFTREGGFSLRVRTRPMEDDPAMVLLQIEVQDSGPGIQPEQLDRIFVPFSQVGRSPSAIEGTGLGLAISKSFVELMGGTIRAESAVGKGSLFQVELPVALAEPGEASAPESSRPVVLGLEADQPAWRILITEDNAENRLLLSTLLVEAGFEVREAENGEEAVELFQQWRPQFIWMDMRMPVMDGFEATKKIRALPGGDAVKIVTLTASAFKDQRKSILEAGGDDVVHKPFRAHEIFEAMARQLGVRYQYEGETKNAPSVTAAPLTSARLATLPMELKNELARAARSLDIELTQEVIEKIRGLDADTADGLMNIVRGFDFHRILELLGERG